MTITRPRNIPLPLWKLFSFASAGVELIFAIAIRATLLLPVVFLALCVVYAMLAQPVHSVDVGVPVPADGWPQNRSLTLLQLADAIITVFQYAVAIAVVLSLLTAAFRPIRVRTAGAPNIADTPSVAGELVEIDTSQLARSVHQYAVEVLYQTLLRRFQHEATNYGIVFQTAADGDSIKVLDADVAVFLGATVEHARLLDLAPTIESDELRSRIEHAVLNGYAASWAYTIVISLTAAGIATIVPQDVVQRLPFTPLDVTSRFEFASRIAGHILGDHRSVRVPDKPWARVDDEVLVIDKPFAS